MTRAEVADLFRPLVDGVRRIWTELRRLAVRQLLRAVRAATGKPVRYYEGGRVKPQREDNRLAYVMSRHGIAAWQRPPGRLRRDRNGVYQARR